MNQYHFADTMGQLLDLKTTTIEKALMARKSKKRRQSHGSAWHWKQTDCWYYTMPGTKKRIALFEENGERIRGLKNWQAADIALAREKLRWNNGSSANEDVGSWVVARVCSEYLQHCEQRVGDGEMSEGHLRNSKTWLNDLCGYCGALPVVKLKKGHLQKWIDSHDSWKSPATPTQT